MALADETSTLPTARRTPYSATRTWVWILIVMFLLAAAVLPPLVNINRYQRRIAQVISTSIGRPVQMSEVKLRLLPRPGFELSDFVVDEDPSFGAEPMLRAPAVIASVRLVSMWRGRLEIARIHLDEPSLNLVRRADGQWNFGTVLLKASSTSNAPTAQRHVSSSPRFPYIEAGNARINFKTGDEKKPFSFLNADLSVWLDNPDEWKLRFEAQPVRTDLDLDLADTGILKINGTVKRAAALNEVPLMLHAEWTKAPLGQLSRLLAGRDAGWRGDLDVRADISGTAANALLKTQLKATSVHRIEFAPREPMDLDANCEARYMRRIHALEDVACTSPLGNGHLLLHGAISQMQQDPLITFQVEMQKVPVSAGLGLARSVQEGFAPNLKAIGDIDGAFSYSGAAIGKARLQGGAVVSGLELTAPALDERLLLPTLRLTASGETITDDSRDTTPDRFRVRKQKRLSPRRSANRVAADPTADAAEPALLLSSFNLPAGGPLPLMVNGRFTSSGYEVHLAGPASVASLVTYSQAFGLLGYTLIPLAPSGSAELDLRTTGTWLTAGSDASRLVANSTTEGRLALRNARISTGYLAAPLEVASAHAVFAGSDVAWDLAIVNYGKLHAEGSLQYSQLCAQNPECLSTFKLKFAALDMGSAQSTLLGGSGRTQLLDLLAKLDRRTHPWPALTGTIEAATLTLEQLVLHDARAAVAIKGNQVAIQSLDAHTLGGSLHLAGTLDASGQRPAYALEAGFTKLNVAELSALFHEKWGAGQVSGSTRLQLAGYKADDLTSSAAGTFQWEWTQGALALPAPAEHLFNLAHFQRWIAAGTVAAGKLSLTDGSVLSSPEDADAAEPVRGTISFQRELDLAIGAAAGLENDKSIPGASLQGTLAQPRLQINSATTPPIAVSSSQALTR